MKYEREKKKNNNNNTVNVSHWLTDRHTQTHKKSFSPVVLLAQPELII